MGRFTADIDIGGTLTDGLFTDGSRAEAVKVDSTPHDFTVCFFDCLQLGSERFGYADLQSFLAEVVAIRWSSTIATNVVAERKGPKVGLLISEGYGPDLYGEGKSPCAGFLIDPAHIEPIADPASEAQVLAAVHRLLAQGVRRICVSLRGAFQDPTAERVVKRCIEQQFPDHYLGSVPVLLGSEILHHPDDQTRTHLAIINAYVHTPLAVALFKAEDDLIRHRYRKPMYIGHVNGGVARVAKTRGVDTVESGPVFGLAASAYFARQYGLSRVLSLDVGGTTAKLGIIAGGAPTLSDRGDLFGIPLQTPWVMLRSIALGGGSVVRVQDGQVTLGPESMGAYPGPACYDLGGTKPTLTDALLVAGALNPARFLGGRRHLSVDQARESIGREVAARLNLEVEEAADRVIARAVEMLAATVADTMTESGGSARDFHLFAFGGNGANLGAMLAKQLGLARSHVFRLGPVFSAFGSSISHIRHLHEEWPYLSLTDPANLASLADRLEVGRRRVLLDLAGEAFSQDQATVTAELVLGGGESPLTLVVPAWAEGEAGSVLALLAAQHPGRTVELLRVQGFSPVPHHEPVRSAVHPHTPLATGQRRIHWGGLVSDADVFDWEQLRPGARITGPAVVEAETNTCTLAVGWRLEVDEFGNALLIAEGR